MTMRYALRPLIVVLTSVATLATSSPAGAQSANGARFITGPLTWSPKFQLREAGVDSNVFNSPNDPKQDTSASGLAQVDSVLTLGILQAATLGNVEYLYFDKYASERGFNRRITSHLEFPVSRFSPDVTVQWAHVKERAGNEIDTRAPRTDFGYAAGIQTRLTSRTDISATAGRQKSTYERGFTFRDIELARQLDRETLLATVTARVTLTPFTVLSTAVSYGQDDFPFRPAAATDNVRVNISFQFSPDAIVSGIASVGYHSMEPHHKGVDSSVAGDFAGVTSAVDLGYNLLGVTRFNGRFSRDSNYSISTSQPFYVSTLGSLTVLQQLFGPVDLDLRASRERLAYAATELAPARTDFADLYGGGLSIRVAPQATVALIYDDTVRRSSGGQLFGYERRRIYTTVTYGL